MKSYLMQFFKYDHLPEPLKDTSKMFAELAGWLDRSILDNPEKSAAMRKLLEAKDCAVRAMIFKKDEIPTCANEAKQ